jgi:flagellin-like hook-associated protein FlgL
MTIFLNGRLQSYIDDLDRIQSALDTTQRQISSGIRVGVASDDAAAVPSILRTQAEIGLDEQTLANLNQVRAQLQAGDSALQQAVKLLDQAISLGAQGASSTADSSKYSALLQQARAVQLSLVDIAATAANGRYIFSGDRDEGPLYELDPGQPNGVRQLAPAESTTRIVDRQGQDVWRPLTATEIFDSGGPTGGNVFAAVTKLVAALDSEDAAAAQTSVRDIKAASEHLNRQLGIYGMAENRVDEAISASASAMVADKQALSGLRDTDVAAAAIALSQAGLQQQAALSVGSQFSRRSLFDFLA